MKGGGGLREMTEYGCLTLEREEIEAGREMRIKKIDDIIGHCD